MMEIRLKPIGRVLAQDNNYAICLDARYIPGLKHITGFSHLHVLWWAHLTCDMDSRNRIMAKNLFKNAPAETGVFASRTTERPNPVMLSTIQAESIDFEKGIITTPFIDAENGTPVIDIKPYFPVERILNCKTPEYYNHWPQFAGEAQFFDWKNEISFDKM